MAESAKAMTDRIRRIVRTFPEVTEVRAHPERDLSNPAETAVLFRVRTRPFAQVLAVVDRAGSRSTVLLLRADPSERQALVAVGHPYFPTGAGSDRLGMVLDAQTDWTDVTELVTESYRRTAPRALVALLDDADGDRRT